jgi:uncharacterized repeat protein (TIGR01451 family)
MPAIPTFDEGRVHPDDCQRGSSPPHRLQAVPPRRSRQEFVVRPAGPRPWLALGVLACIGASFGIISMLELGHRTSANADPLVDLQAPPAIFEPVAARPLAEVRDAAADPPPNESADAAAGQPASRFSSFEGQLTGGSADLDFTSQEQDATLAAAPWDADPPLSNEDAHDTPEEAPAVSEDETPASEAVPYDSSGGASDADLDADLDAEASDAADEEGTGPEETLESEPDRPLTLADLPPIPAGDMPPPPFASRGAARGVEAASASVAASVDEEPLADGEGDQPEQPSDTEAFRLGTAADAVGPGRAPAAASFGRINGGFDDPDAPVPVTPPSQASAGAMPQAGVPGSGPVFTPPAASRYASSDALRAFGGELPQRPDPAASAGPFADPARGTDTDTAVAESRGEGYGTTGIGVPGPAMLEGVQAPQVAVEKRGPREVQVGKLARYEMLVRNVSAVVAHDVELTDLVPKGTTLVSTTPPAAPGVDGELSWQIGSLDPGAQARVLVEVLPVEEGEVGSVASVRFAAKASVRSLATRPALAIEVSPPEPTRVGGDIPVTISVSNPGTGRATGVVLEGMLPAGLAHRAGQELEFDIGSLAPGETRSIDLLLASTGPGRHRVELGVRADGQLEERLPVTVEVTAPTLELTAELPARRYLQRPATCVLSMANAGTAAARSVELAAQLPPGLKFVSANNAGYYDEKTHRVLWQLEELPPAEIGSVEVVLMPIALGSQQIVAAARSPDGLSDQITKMLEVEGVAALTFTVVDSEDPIEVEGVTEYVVRVGNQGTQAASNVQVMATILGDMQPVDASGPVDHRISNLTVTFEPLARLAPTEETVFRVRVRGKRAGDQRVQVQITSADHPTPVSKEEITRVYSDR